MRLGLQKKMITISQPSVVEPSNLCSTGNVDASFICADAGSSVIWNAVTKQYFEVEGANGPHFAQEIFGLSNGAFPQRGAQSVRTIARHKSTFVRIIRRPQEGT